MIKTLVTVALAACSMNVMAQKDSTKIKVDTIKSKQTGALIFNTNMVAFGPQTDSLAKPNGKPDTLKIGAIKDVVIFYAMSPQTDSLKAKPKAADTVKTKYASAVALNAALAFNQIDGPQTDSTKTKSTIVKPDSTTRPGADKKTGAMYFDKKTGSIIAMPKATVYYI